MRTDFDLFFRKCLASVFELELYKSIMDDFNEVDVSKDVDFQRNFNSFYKVRRNKEWRDIYYKYFQSIRRKEPKYRDIITYLYNETGNIEVSFASKMLATINPDKPIWDRNVLRSLDFSLPDSVKGEERLNIVVKIYDRIEMWINNFIDSKEGREYISWFNKVLPEYSDSISDVKKVDCYLWKCGEFNRIIDRG